MMKLVIYTPSIKLLRALCVAVDLFLNAANFFSVDFIMDDQCPMKKCIQLCYESDIHAVCISDFSPVCPVQSDPKN